MEIPDRLSDMDSVPDTISLGREAGVDAVCASLQATTEDLTEIVFPNLVRATVAATESLKGLKAAVDAAEVSELESMYLL